MITRWIGVALTACVIHGFPAALCAQVTPDKTTKTFTVSPGLEWKLWASEPLFVNPTCMDIDHLGRAWVCESVNYRNKLRNFQKWTRPEGDRIVILEDSSGKGMADRATTFYQHPDVMAPLGIAVAKNSEGPGWKVYLCQSPDILVLEDKDGNGKADGPPRKLLTGFRGIDHDHGVHGILIGPDRKLYFSVGDAGVENLQSSDGKGRKWTSNSTDCRAGTIWRCDMDGTHLELLAHNFRNEYEPCVDSFGNIFVSDNDDDGNQQTRICQVMPGGNYGYHPRGRGETHWHEEQPGVVPKVLRTYFGSPTGMCFYEGKLLPRKYWGQALHTDAGPRHVRAYHLTPKGASFDVEREDIVSSTDNWFRPADVCVAPDGSVLVADWYDPGVGGHGMGDIQRGRIYRLAPTGSAYSVPKVDLDSNNGILAALNSPALSVRWMAMAKLDSMPRADALALLEPAGLQVEDAVLRARALWQIARLGGNKAESRALQSVLATKDDPRFLALAVRLSKDTLATPPEKLAAYLDGLKTHQPAATGALREGLLALRDMEPERAKKTISELMQAYDGKDRHYLAAVGIAVGNDPKRREILLADFDQQFPDWNEKVAGLVWELRPPKLLSLLGRHVKDASLSPEQRARIVDILATSMEPQAGESLLNLLGEEVPSAVQERVVENLRLFLPTKWQALKKNPRLNDVLSGLLDKPATRETALALIAAANRDNLADTVVRLARARNEPVGVRRAAIATLGQLRQSEALAQMVDHSDAKYPEMQSDVVKALGEVCREGAPGSGTMQKAMETLQGLVRSGKSPAVRELAVLGLAAGRPGSMWLLNAHAKNQLPEELTTTAGRVLRNSPYQDLRNKALVAFPSPGKLNPRKLPPLNQLATRRGDVNRGKQLLAASTTSNLQCLKCHTVRGVGGQVGPDLSMIGKKASRENLLESILYPGRAIADQYVTWILETTRGVTVQGLLVEETPEVVILRDAEGRDIRVAKSDIESRNKGPKSLMPEDLLVHLGEEELVDLVEYLLTLKTPTLTIDTWHIAGPFDNGNGMEGLDRVFLPEKLQDPQATYEGKHGKVRWRTVRVGAGGYVDLATFHGSQAGQTVSYLWRDVVSPVDQQATVV
ncbi:MAG: PVC-type heme-binding CxxCH protein, partial [Gemmataceae bacterium]